MCTAYLCQLGASEWHMALHAIQSSDALLEGQQALVDLSTLQPGLPVIVICICNRSASELIPMTSAKPVIKVSKSVEICASKLVLILTPSSLICHPSLYVSAPA